MKEELQNSLLSVVCQCALEQSTQIYAHLFGFF